MPKTKNQLMKEIALALSSKTNVELDVYRLNSHELLSAIVYLISQLPSLPYSAEDIVFENKGTEITAENIQAAIESLSAEIKGLESAELDLATIAKGVEKIPKSISAFTLAEFASGLKGKPQPPYITKISDGNFSQSTSKDIAVEGSFFTPDIKVTSPGLEISKVEFVSSHEIILSATARDTAGVYDISFDNGSVSTTLNAIEVTEVQKGIVDLRQGGTEFSESAIEMRSGMSFTRTVDGMFFEGSTPWSSWARFVGENNAWVWNRSQKKTLSWIFTNTERTMTGIGSRENDPNSTSQWIEGEIMGYFVSGTYFYGFYGNSGTPGNYVSYPSRTSSENGWIKKLVLRNNGEPGSNYGLYRLPSDKISDWSNTRNQISAGIITNNMTADAAEIMPFVIPNEQNTLFLGFIIE